MIVFLINCVWYSRDEINDADRFGDRGRVYTRRMEFSSETSDRVEIS